MAGRPRFITGPTGGTTGCMDANGNLLNPSVCCSLYPNFDPNFCDRVSSWEWHGNSKVPNIGVLLYGSASKASASISVKGASNEIKRSLRNLISFRPIMLMYLRNANVPVRNPNNMYEIVAKYAAIQPLISKRLSIGQIKNLVEYANGTLTEHFDFSSLFAAVGSLIEGIAGAVSAGNLAQQIKDFIPAYTEYMRVDLKAIGDTYNVTKAQSDAGQAIWPGFYGPKGALDMLKQYKNTSWKDLKAYIENVCTQLKIPVPKVITDFWEGQNNLERQLQLEVNPNAIVGSGSGSGNYTDTPFGDIGKYLPWIIGGLLLFLVLGRK